MLIMTVEMVPAKFLKPITSVKDLYEIRIEEGGNIFRVFCCFDEFTIGEQLKDERLKAGLTQEELAEKIGTKKSFISRVEKGRADIQLSTLVKVFRGVGREISVRVL